jgi:hypothetical protein
MCEEIAVPSDKMEHPKSPLPAYNVEAALNIRL